MISIVIVNWNTCDLLFDLLNSLQEHAPMADFEILVVDNASTDGSPKMVAEHFPAVTSLINHSNVGFARGANRGIQESKGQYILLLNTDMLVLEGAIDAQAAFMESNPRCGICGGQLLNQDRLPDLSYGHFPSVRSLLTEILLYRWGWKTTLGCTPAPDQNQPLEVDFVSGADLMIRRQAVERIGLLDERFFLYFEETDWCYRAIQAGWKVCYVPAAQYIHYRAASASSDLSRQTQFNTGLNLFLRKNYRGAYFVACWLLGQLFQLLSRRRARKRGRV